MSRPAYQWMSGIVRAFARWAPVFCIPTVALLVATRQVYLNRYHDLTTWKGGGMGMFAGADASLNRYAKVFITDPRGKREPLTQLTPDQSDLLNRALNYPVRRNFLVAAKAIATLDWIAKRQRMPVALIDSKGKNVGTAAESYYLMVPFGTRPREEKWKWDIQIEYWKLSYDPGTRRAHAVLAETFVFSPEELQPHERS
jgi:hypothetical protein